MITQYITRGKNEQFLVSRDFKGSLPVNQLLVLREKSLGVTHQQLAITVINQQPLVVSRWLLMPRLQAVV